MIGTGLDMDSLKSVLIPTIAFTCCTRRFNHLSFLASRKSASYEHLCCRPPATMQALMIGIRQQFKIREVIIELIAVLMVNLFIRQELPAKDFLNNASVLKLMACLARLDASDLVSINVDIQMADTLTAICLTSHT